MTQVILLHGATSPWSKPGDFTHSGHTVELIGCGGSGGIGAVTAVANQQGGGGGGGGAYQKLTYSSGSIGASIPFSINTNNSSTSLNEANGTIWGATTNVNAYVSQSGLAGKAGGSANVAQSNAAQNFLRGALSPVLVYTISVTSNGGIGGNVFTGHCAGAGGGGGAGGNTGVGGGGGSSGAANTGGGGGGGSSNATGTGAAPATTTGGTGGRGNPNSGNGQGGTIGTAGGSATAGSGAGGGGGGFANASAAAHVNGGNGANDNLFSAAAGVGGGGGGGGSDANTVTGGITSGGNGADFGGGGGGSGGAANTTAAQSTRTAGTGGNGAIVINYTPASVSTLATVASNALFARVRGKNPNTSVITSSSPVIGAVRNIQSISNSSASLSSNAFTMSYANAISNGSMVSGYLYVLATGGGSFDGMGINSLTDNKGNQYYLGPSLFSGANMVWPFWATNITNGPNNFIVTMASGSFTKAAIVADEYAGTLNDAPTYPQNLISKSCAPFGFVANNTAYTKANTVVAVPNGSLVVTLWTSGTTVCQLTGVTDPSNNIWNVISGQTGANGQTLSMAWTMVTNTIPIHTAFSPQFSGGTNYALLWGMFMPPGTIDAANVQDTSNVLFGKTTTQTTNTISSGTLATANELLIASLITVTQNGDTLGNWTEDSTHGWTTWDAGQPGGVLNPIGAVSFKLNTGSTSSVTWTPSWTTAVSNSTGIMVSFRFANGVYPCNPLDANYKWRSFTSGTATNNVDAQGVTTSTNGDLIYGVTVDTVGNTASFSAGTNLAFNLRNNIKFTSPQIAMATEDFIQTAAASENTAFTTTVGSAGSITFSMPFKIDYPYSVRIQKTVNPIKAFLAYLLP